MALAIAYDLFVHSESVASDDDGEVVTTYAAADDESKILNAYLAYLALSDIADSGSN